MTEFPSRRALLVLAAAVVALELVVAATQVPSFARFGYEHAREPHRLVRNADVDPLASFAPTAPFVLAQQAIPADATYAVVVGEDPPVADPELVRIIFRFWLLPRTYTSEPSEADWVIAYHRSSESLGIPYRQEIGIGPAVNALEVGT